MTDNNQFIEHLIPKSIHGNLTDEEKLLLNKWIDDSEENAREYKAYQELWNKSKKLVLSDAIDIESSLAKTKNKISLKTKKKFWFVGIRQIAAILLISVTLSVLYNYFSASESSNTIYQDISAAYGTQTSLVLADGTKVWLNSGSHLRFPTSFKNMDNRKIELEGEAFFEVTKDADHPFIVSANEIDVKVLGTAFNVLAYSDSPELTVALKEGKVSLYRSNSQNQNEIVSLVPNEVATYNRSSKTMDLRKEAYLDKYISWKEGRIVFFEDRIETVAQKLEKWYNVDIEIDGDKLNNSRVTATFIDESLEQMLNYLSISSLIKYSIVPPSKNSDGSFTRRKIILSDLKN